MNLHMIYFDEYVNYYVSKQDNVHDPSTRRQQHQQREHRALRTRSQALKEEEKEAARILAFLKNKVKQD